MFCEKIRQMEDRRNYILHRGKHNFVVLNLFPYTSGHLLIVPFLHAALLEDIPDEALVEMMQLTSDASRHLRAVYRPRGLNIGMNIGECAGAGVAEHIHMHVLPRWPGDVNFMTSVGETRVLPEALETTYEKLKAAFEQG